MFRKLLVQNTSTECAECDAECHSAQHTLTECPAIAAQHRSLQNVIGDDLYPNVDISTLLGSDSETSAFLNFCEEVLGTKENNEKSWEASGKARKAAKTLFF